MRGTLGLAWILVVALALFLPSGCGDDDGGTGPQGDTTPPAAVTDLSVASTTDSSATLVWSAPGDDGMAGAATEYDIRYSATSLTEGFPWDAATQVDSTPAPKTAGMPETLAVTGLTGKPIVYFALKAADEVPNWSTVSNVASAELWWEDMVLIPAGTFTMGSDDDEGYGNELPEHQPYVSAFYMDLYEVTTAEYAEGLNWAVANGYAYWNGSDVVESSSGNTIYMRVSDPDCRIDRSGSSFVAQSGYETHPVLEVSWYGAAAYCNWRSLREGVTPCYDTGTWECDFGADAYRLPTEAEWEKAARGSSDERTYPWGEGIDCSRANYYPSYAAACVGGTSPVGSYGSGRSPYGVYDMAGNVWEWCNDWYKGDYYSSSSAIDPRGPSSGTYRVFRGGAWGYDASAVRCALRLYWNPSFATDGGFRCVRSQ